MNIAGGVDLATELKCSISDGRKVDFFGSNDSNSSKICMAGNSAKRRRKYACGLSLLVRAIRTRL